MAANKDIVESCLLYQILFDFVSIRGWSWSSFKSIFFWALKSWLERECTIKTLHLLRLRIVIAWAQIRKCDWFNIQWVKDITSLSYVFIRLTKGALVSQLLLIERREGFVIVVYVRARLVSLLGSIEYFSLREPESPSFLELCIFLLENILKIIVWCRWPSGFPHLLKSISLREADWYQGIPHGICRLFFTYEPKELRGVLNQCIKGKLISYCRTESVFLEASCRHHLSWICLVNWARVSFLEVSHTSTNFLIQLHIRAFRCIARKKIVNIGVTSVVLWEPSLIEILLTVYLAIIDLRKSTNKYSKFSSALMWGSTCAEYVSYWELRWWWLGCCWCSSSVIFLFSLFIISGGY